MERSCRTLKATTPGVHKRLAAQYKDTQLHFGGRCDKHCTHLSAVLCGSLLNQTPAKKERMRTLLLHNSLTGPPAVACAPQRLGRLEKYMLHRAIKRFMLRGRRTWQVAPVVVHQRLGLGELRRGQRRHASCRCQVRRRPSTLQEHRSSQESKHAAAGHTQSQDHDKILAVHRLQQ